MIPLHPSLTVDLRKGEWAASFCSRAALLVGRSARDFCRDMGFTFQDIVDGRDPALEALALRTRTEIKCLGAASVRKVGEHRFSLRGQALVRDALSRKTLRVCPHCIRKDIDECSEPMAVRPYGRTVWLVGPFRTCPKHRVGLVAISVDDHPQRVHDFAALVQPAIPNIVRIADAAPRRRISAFESYLLARCEGRDTDDAPFLTALPFYAAAKTCEVIGAITTYGIRFRMDLLSDTERQEVAAEGFGIASAGEHGIRRFLSDLQDRVRSAKGDWGPRLVFGRLYEWLAHETEDPAYEPLRDIIRRHVMETMPVGPGEEVLGQGVLFRRLHSVRSASLEIGAHPKRLRKLLHAAGHVSSESLDLSDSWVMFDAMSTYGFLERVSEAMTLGEAAEYLNVPRPHDRLLFDAGFIVPFVRGGKGILKDHAFARRDLDAFLKRLLADAPYVDPNDGVLVSIPSAAKRASCSAVEIVRLILDRKLTRVRRRADAAGYLSVLIDPNEVKPFVQGQADGSLSLREVEQRLGTATRVVKSLIEHGHLPSRVEINPVNRCPRQVVKQDDLDEFMARYVSLHVAATEAGIHFRRLMSAIAEAGIRPAFDPKNVCATFYNRRSIADVKF